MTRSASIAVLPFTDMSAAKDQDWFCDGVAEEILNALSQVKGLTRRRARIGVLVPRQRRRPEAAIGEKLQVATVLDGSVRRVGRSAAHHRAALRRHQRLSAVVGALRPRV